MAPWRVSDPFRSINGGGGGGGEEERGGQKGSKMYEKQWKTAKNDQKEEKWLEYRLVLENGWNLILTRPTWPETLQESHGINENISKYKTYDKTTKTELFF